MARPTRSNIRDEEDSKHMSYIPGSDLSERIPRKAPVHHVQYVLLAYPRRCALAESKFAGYNVPADANTY
jgi:predicted heme/steroid binding protein